MKKSFTTKAFTVFAAAIMLVSAIPFFSLNASAAEVPGDIDGNNVLDSGDSLLVIRSSVGLYKLTEDQQIRADVNGDGVVDVADALSMLQAAVGIIESPVNEAARALSAYEREVVRLCNAERAKVGVGSLRIDKTLCKAAKIRVSELKESCDHIRPDGSKWSTVLNDLGYHYMTAGENVAGGIVTPAEVVAAWMDSPGHRANILNPEYNMIGVATTYIEDSQYHTYWEQMFSGVSADFENEQEEEKKLLDKINTARKRAGLSSLSLDSKLSRVAEIRADDITVSMSNTRPDGSDWKVLTDQYAVDYMTLSQIFCAGQKSADEVFDYYTEEGKTPKFLDPNKDFHKIGIGHAFAENDTYSHYWVMIFTD